MSIERKYPRSGRRAIIDANNLLTLGSDATIVCLPIAALEVCRQMLRDRAYWRTSYAVSYGDEFYTLPDNTQLDAIMEQIDEFFERTNLMDCNDLTAQLTAIADGIASLGGSGGCGCGSGGGSDTSGPPDSTDTGDITETTGTPPAGYPDWETYQVAKCDVATMIVQRLIDDIRWWQTVQIATLTLAALSAGMVSILSAFTLTAILAGLLALLAYEITALEDAEDQFVTGFEDLVCAIMAGTDAASSMANYISEMETQIASAIVDPITEFLLQTLFGYWADTESFNLLYADYDTFLAHQVPPGADCGECGGGCHTFYVHRGEWLGGLTFASEFSGGNWRTDIWWNANTGSCSDLCGPMGLMTVDSTPGRTHSGSGANDFRMYTDAECPTFSTPVDAYDSDTAPPSAVCHRYVIILSATEFTVTFGRLGHCF